MEKMPYSEIINVVDEQKEYSLLCQGKSKKYTCYTEWETHIEECLSRFKTSEDLYNFKRYCRNIERTSARAPESVTTYIALLIPILVEIVFEEIPWWAILIWFVGTVAYTMKQSKVLIRESYFYTDIIEIIEKIENCNNEVDR